MVKKLSAAKRRKRDEGVAAFRNIAIVIALLGIVAFFYFKSVMAHRTLDDETLCPAQPESLIVL